MKVEVTRDENGIHFEIKDDGSAEYQKAWNIVKDANAKEQESSGTGVDSLDGGGTMAGMCDEVKIDGQWCETIGQLRRALPGAEIVKSRNYIALPKDEACLCGVDICSTLIRSGREEYDHEPGSGRWVVRG